MTGSHSLEGFGRLILSKYGKAEEIPTGDGTSEDFVKYFDLSFSPNLIELHLLAEQYGIGKMQATNLPENLRRYHYSYNGSDPTILYEQDAWTGRKEHTILHELYEIIQEKFEDLDLGYKKPEDPQISWEADRFAAAVLMQREVFLRALFDTGVDVIQLHHRFGRAYSSIVIRAVELLRENIDFLAATYLARPIFWFRKLAKVVLIGVRYKDRHLFQHQVELINPILVERSYQLI